MPKFRIHYYRPDAHFENWAVYSFDDTAEPDDFNAGPTFPAGVEEFGVFYDIELKENARDLGFIVHNVATGVKDPGPDMHVDLAQHSEAWIVSKDATLYTSEPTRAQILNATFFREQAFWIDRTTVAIQPDYFEPDWSYSLVCSQDASLSISAGGALTGAIVSLQLQPNADGLTPAQLTRFPQLARYAIFRLTGSAAVSVSDFRSLLTGQLAIAANEASGEVSYLTGVQTAGVLDDLFYYAGRLGVLFSGESIEARVWAPTAQSVKLLIFRDQAGDLPEQTITMQEEDGVWRTAGAGSWRGKYYLFHVTVYVPHAHQMVENLVTDPYSTDLALNGTRSRFTDLADSQTKPDGWDEHRSPALSSLNDLNIYELHVRDFSSADRSVPTERRGTYLAFTDPETNGMRHLRRLAEAGLKAVHLLPTFHFGSVNEDKSTWSDTGDLSGFPADSAEQQARIAQVQDTDNYNWGYDPVHFLAPEGSYAVTPDERVKECRAMVLGLHTAGLRVIQDQVFNHTISSGQDAQSIFDRIVPGYYHRLDADGNVENGSCCSDTASENRMMEKLMIDTLVQNAREYKVDGFRFDLMGLHFVSNMLNIKDALSLLTLEKDGVEGTKIYLYGEGWEVGTPANNALGPNASQTNMFGTGIGTFSDRIRDGIRGGGPFSDPLAQGFATGLFTDSNQYTNEHQSEQDQRSTVLAQGDWIKVAMSGNLRDFNFTDSAGETVTGGQVNYNGGRAGYTASPLEAVNFCSVHDNQTLFDAIQLKSATSGGESSASNNPADVRARRLVVAMSLVALGQGIPFFMAGDDLLRSKDMDANSFNSGEWFNRLDFSYRSSNWGIGLPMAKDNQASWPIMQPLLADSALTPGSGHIAYARDAFRELLQIRESSALFRMTTPAEIQANLRFLNNGPAQLPGLLVMQLSANSTDQHPLGELLVICNATRQEVRFQSDELKGLALQLHPVQASSNDPIVRGSSFDADTGSAIVPELTTAVFAAASPKT